MRHNARHPNPTEALTMLMHCGKRMSNLPFAQTGVSKPTLGDFARLPPPGLPAVVVKLASVVLIAFDAVPAAGDVSVAAPFMLCGLSVVWPLLLGTSVPELDFPGLGSRVDEVFVVSATGVGFDFLLRGLLVVAPVLPVISVVEPGSAVVIEEDLDFFPRGRLVEASDATPLGFSVDDLFFLLLLLRGILVVEPSTVELPPPGAAVLVFDFLLLRGLFVDGEPLVLGGRVEDFRLRFRELRDLFVVACGAGSAVGGADRVSAFSALSPATSLLGWRCGGPLVALG